MKKRTTEFNVELFRKTLQNSSIPDGQVEKMVAKQLEDMGFKSEEECDAAFAAGVLENAKKQLNDDVKRELKDLDAQCERVSRTIDRKYQREYITRVESMKARGYTEEMAKTQAEAIMANNYGQVLYGNQAGKQLKFIKDEYDYSDSDLDSIKLLMETYGINAPQAVEKLLQNNLEAENQLSSTHFYDDDAS